MRLAICADQLGGTRMELLATDLGKSREQLCARGTLRDSFELGEEVVRKRAALQRRARFEPSMHGIWHVADLDHLRHVYSMFACAAHVKLALPTDRSTLAYRAQHVQPRNSLTRRQLAVARRVDPLRAGGNTSCSRPSTCPWFVAELRARTTLATAAPCRISMRRRTRRSSKPAARSAGSPTGPRATSASTPAAPASRWAGAPATRSATGIARRRASSRSTASTSSRAPWPDRSGRSRAACAAPRARRAAASR